MASTESRPERTETDNTLRDERSHTDEELVTRSTAAGEDADDVIRLARERATAVLELARGREEVDPRDASRVAATRAMEDSLLDAEYVAADRALHDERERRRLAVRQLLALERRATDKAFATERAIVDSSQMGRESLDTLVHDLRSMLTAVSLSAASIVLAASGNQPAEVLVNLGANIQRAAAQMELLLADLQDLAALDAGRTRLTLAQHDFGEVVRTAVEIHEPAAAANGLTLTATLKDEPMLVSIDAPRFTRVIANLLANAIKFTPRGGSITVTAGKKDDGIELTVADTGPGIPSELQVAIFERFRQGPSASGRARGVGLGLYIARSIVVAHGGRIWVESTPDDGATFRVRLPARA